MQTFSLKPWRAVTSMWMNRELIWQLSKRDVIGRYRGSMMGILWSFFNPLLMLAVYTFFFTEVFNARWRLESESKGEFAVALFVGLIVHTFFAECASKAPNLIVSNPSYVKRIIFPLEVLPVISVISALFHMLISLTVLAGFIIMVYGSLPTTFVFFPLIAAPLAVVACSAGWLLSALGVYLRDVSQTVGIIIMVMMYLSPLFFPVEVMPERFRGWLYFNPLTLLMTEGRKILIWGEMPDVRALLIHFLGACIAAWLCFILFQKARRGFADVL